MRNKKFLRGVYICSIVGVLFISSLLFVGFNNKKSQQKTDMYAKIQINKIYDNIFINDVHVGGLTVEDAIKKLDDSLLDKIKDEKIELLLSPTEIDTIMFADLNIKLDVKEVVEEAYNYAREGNIKSRYNKVKDLDKNPKYFNVDSKITYDLVILQEKLDKINDNFKIEQVNARMKRENGNFVYVDEVNGREIDTEKTLEELYKNIEKLKSVQINAIVKESKANYTVDDFAKSKDLIGSYTSPYTGDDGGRISNLRNGVEKLNGWVVYPNEVFSTNVAFGEMSVKNGYSYAPVIVDGKFIEDIGGGICQVSTALYNAIMKAELEVVERRNHSLKVGYADYGFDATLAGNYIDLKFKNDTEYPLLIESYIDGKNVVVNLWGNEIHERGREVKYEKVLVETILPDIEEVIEDDTMPEGERFIKSPARNGYKYNVYKVVTNNGVEVEKTLYNTSNYRATRGEVVLGTKRIEKPLLMEDNNKENSTEEPILTEDNNKEKNENINSQPEETNDVNNKVEKNEVSETETSVDVEETSNLEVTEGTVEDTELPLILELQ